MFRVHGEAAGHFQQENDMSWLLCGEVEREQYREVKTAVFIGQKCRNTGHFPGFNLPPVRQTAAEDKSNVLIRLRCLQPAWHLPTGHGC